MSFVSECGENASTRRRGDTEIGAEKKEILEASRCAQRGPRRSDEGSLRAARIARRGDRENQLAADAEKK
jgi:hypothetical protein